ncbi:MAG: hypothetical protein M3Z36_00450 [Acidobacteriota bacterium]|nr:hypothetical protein [Acidobacteriota bacterium]
MSTTGDPLFRGPLPLAPLLLLLLFLLLTGCGKGSPPPDIVPIVKALMAAAALATARTKAASAAKHYLERRVLYLIGKNGGWATESGFTSLIARLGSEMNQVGAFVDDRVTTLGGSDPVSPGHRDLQDAAKHLTIDGPSAISTQFQTNKSERAERIGQIVWRACAIQPELWSGGDSTLSPALQKPAATEVLDRRLHSVEMLVLHDQGKLGKWSVAAANSGWKDQQRTSMFQYPNVRFADPEDHSDFAPALAAAGLSIAALAPDWISDGTEIDYRLQARVRPEADSEWVWDQGGYFLSLAPGATGAAAMNHLIPITPAVTDPKFEDFQERNLMFCDIMLATLHLQGLRFSRLRRTNADTDFNTATAAGVTLRPLIPQTGPPVVTRLMADGAKWFEVVAIPHDELQVGDHLIYWNNQFVRHILGSAFGLENSYVTRIDSDGYAVMLAGHGMVESTESNFAAEMAKFMNDQFVKMRAGINLKFAANPAITILGASVAGVRFQLVKWAPFGEMFGPRNSQVLLKADGAWWVRLKLSLLHDRADPVPSVADALTMIPKSIRVEDRMQKPPLPAGDFQPDYQESIYLPMSLPYPEHNGWEGYLAHPKGAGDTVSLVDLIPDGSMIPGFYFKGRNQDSKIPVLRPKVQI